MYRQRVFQLAVVCMALAAATRQLEAGIITSASDPALIGATIEDFNSATLGTYTTLILADLTVTSPNSLEVQTGSSGQYVPPNPGGDQYLLEFGGLLTFTFNSPVSAFGLYVGATNYQQSLTAYDSNGNVIDSLTIPDQVSTLPHPYSGFYGISSSSANISYFTTTLNSGDGIVYDDLYYTSSSSVIPEPSSLALLGLGSLGMIGWRRKRKTKLAA